MDGLPTSIADLESTAPSDAPLKTRAYEVARRAGPPPARSAGGSAARALDYDHDTDVAHTPDPRVVRPASALEAPADAGALATGGRAAAT
ncbi:MAG TPA: hypothetical protein VFM27_05105 [Acidimicrobiales bacterium]|nr:hypothetical protein [Acidimicrobiales bacterium]